MEMTPSIDEIRWLPLGAVCEAWEKDRKTIIWHYWNQEVGMVKVGKRWLVKWEDVAKLFGEPPNPIVIKIE